MESYLVAVDVVGRNDRSWCYIQGSTHNHQNEGKTNNLGWGLYSAYACAWWMKYSAYAYTRCMQYSGYAVHGVCCTRCQLMIMTWRDREGWLTFVFCNHGKVVDEKERDGGWRWGRCGGYERIWEISGMTWLIGLRRPRIGVITCQIGTRTCHVGDGQLTRTRNSLSPIFSWWYASSLHISLLLVLNFTVT